VIFTPYLKEVKGGKRICITVGTFTEEAKRYTEAHLIDLIKRTPYRHSEHCQYKNRRVNLRRKKLIPFVYGFQ
jgi:hypothetical protein